MNEITDRMIVEEPVPRNAVEKVLFTYNKSEKRLSYEFLKNCNFHPKTVCWWPEGENFHITITGRLITVMGIMRYFHELYDALALCKLPDDMDKMCLATDKENE